MSASNYEAFFKQADTDNSGTLDLKELITMLRKHGYKQSDADLKRVFATVDTSGDGKISLNEYMVAMGQQPAEVHGQAAMRSVFVDFDKNGDGTISRDELKQVFKELKKSFSDAELERMISLADKDQSGSLDYEEFIKFCFGK